MQLDASFGPIGFCPGYQATDSLARLTQGNRIAQACAFFARALCLRFINRGQSHQGGHVIGSARSIGAAAIVLIMSTCCATAHADTVTFKSGTVMTDVLTEDEGESIRITKADGSSSMLYPKSLIAKIEVKATPAQELSERMKALRPKDASARVALAKWCEERKLIEEARALYQEALSIDPANEAAHIALGHRMVEGKWLTDPEKINEAEARPIAVALLEAWRSGGRDWEGLTGVDRSVHKVAIHAYQFEAPLSQNDVRGELLWRLDQDVSDRMIVNLRLQSMGDDTDEVKQEYERLNAAEKDVDRDRRGDATAIAKCLPNVYVGLRFRVDSPDAVDGHLDLLLCRDGATWRVMALGDRNWRDH